jgi:hypothetical protein
MLLESAGGMVDHTPRKEEKMTKLPATFASLQRIVAEHSAYRLHWPASQRLPKARSVLVDAVTAKAVVTVHGALSEANKAKLERMLMLGPDKLVRLAEIAYKNRH